MVPGKPAFNFWHVPADKLGQRDITVNHNELTTLSSLPIFRLVEALA